VGGSTLTETTPSAKTGSGKPRAGFNPGQQPLDRVRADSSGQGLTTNQGVPIATNQASLKAGLRGPALLAALTDPWPRSERSRGVSTFVPGEPPATLDAIPAWLAAAMVVPTEELIHDDHS
jgi:hypothetical protein